jgi:hypothetical protein
MTPVREALEALRHADIDLSMLLSEIANDEMRASVRKTLDMIDRARKALSAAPGEPCAVKPLEWVETHRNRSDEEPVPPQPAAGWDEAAGYAERLAVTLWEKHYKNDAPQWKPLSGDLIGLLTQIDNMTSALRREAPAPAEGVKSLHGMIAAIYGSLDAEDCLWIDREWAKMRGYVIPSDNSVTLAHPDTAEARLREADRREIVAHQAVVLAVANHLFLSPEFKHYHKSVAARADAAKALATAALAQSEEEK